MPRYKLIAAREKAELSQSGLAGRLGVDRKVVNRWERGVAEPRMEYRQDIRKHLNNNSDPELFENFECKPEELIDQEPCEGDNCQQMDTKQQMSAPCQTDTPHDRMDSSDSIDIPESEAEPLSMDKLRREIAKVVGTTLIGSNLESIDIPHSICRPYGAYCSTRGIPPTVQCYN